MGTVRCKSIRQIVKQAYMMPCQFNNGFTETKLLNHIQPKRGNYLLFVVMQIKSDSLSLNNNIIILSKTKTIKQYCAYKCKYKLKYIHISN